MIDRTCSYEGCPRHSSSLGYCTGHYQQFKKGTPLRPLATANSTPSVCEVSACDRPVHLTGLCSGHYGKKLRGVELGEIREFRLELDDPRGWFVDNRGYMRKTIGNKRVYQHRYAMEIKLGRALVRGEEVHHLNGDRTDNRIENLELWSTSQPSGQRVEDKLAWAYEIIELYENYGGEA